MKVDWTFIDSNTSEVYCARCGAREKFSLPMPVRAFTKFVDYFNEKHRFCKEVAP